MASSLAIPPPPPADATGANATASPAIPMARGAAHGRSSHRRPETGCSSLGTRPPARRDSTRERDQPTASLHGRMRRNLFLLACCQAIGQSGNTMMFSATALSVVTFFPHRDLATLPVTLQHLGVMLSVFPAARSEEHTSELQSRQYLVCR